MPCRAGIVREISMHWGTRQHDNTSFAKGMQQLQAPPQDLGLLLERGPAREITKQSSSGHGTGRAVLSGGWSMRMPNLRPEHVHFRNAFLKTKGRHIIMFARKVGVFRTNCSSGACLPACGWSDIFYLTLFFISPIFMSSAYRLQFFFFRPP